MPISIEQVVGEGVRLPDNRLARAVAIVNAYISWIAIRFTMVLLACIGLLLFFQVVARYVLPVQFFWVEEVARITLVWISCIGAGAITWERGHIAVDAIVQSFPRRLRLFFSLLGDVIMIVSSLIVVCFAAEVAVALSNRFTTGAHLPRSIYFIPFVIGFALIVMHAVSLIVTERFGYRSAPKKPGAPT